MKIKHAVSHLGKRFFSAAAKEGKHKILYLNQNDITALESIDKYVAEKEQEQFQNNEAFAKMFILFYKKVLEDEGSTVMSNHARRKIGKFLEKPLNEIIQDFTDFLNESDQYGFLESIGIELSHPVMISEGEKTINATKLKEAVREPKNMEKFLGEVWGFDFVKDALMAEVNNMLSIIKK